MTQHDLFPPMPEAEARWREWHRDNPRVYELFQQYTLQAINAGRPRYSARVVIERIRWHVNIETRGDEFKINDHYTPYYARLFMRDHPQHAGFFETRERLAA